MQALGSISKQPTPNFNSVDIMNQFQRNLDNKEFQNKIKKQYDFRKP